MSNPTPAPIVAPDLSTATVDKAVSELATVSGPFIPTKVRAAIYTVGGLASVAAGAIALVVGGVIGRDLELVGSAAGVLTAVLAVSHVNK